MKNIDVKMKVKVKMAQNVFSNAARLRISVICLLTANFIYVGIVPRSELIVTNND